MISFCILNINSDIKLFYSFCQTAAMTFEDEKMENAMRSLKRTQKMCDVDSLFEGVLNKRPSEKWTTEERIQRMIIWADCELFMAFLMFLKQSKYVTAIISRRHFTSL